MIPGFSAAFLACLATRTGPAVKKKISEGVVGHAEKPDGKAPIETSSLILFAFMAILLDKLARCTLIANRWQYEKSR